VAHDFSWTAVQKAVSAGVGYQIPHGFHNSPTEEDGAAMSVTPYVCIPLAIFEARKSGSISTEQMNLLICAYVWASRPGFRVAAYSAQRVCEFQGLAIDRANFERYRRAAVDLLARNLIKRDYRKIDPRRSNQKERTYSIWVPAPGRFVTVGTPEENHQRLWSGSLSINTHCESGQTRNATPIADASDSKSETYTGEETCNASVSRHAMRIPNQENQKIETLPSSQGEASPLPSPPGRRSSGAGLLENRKPLPSVAADNEKRTALLFIDFVNRYWSFTPDLPAVESLLKRFSPEEVLCVMNREFPLGETHRSKLMAYFFFKGAYPLIEASRLKQESLAFPVDGFTWSTDKTANQKYHAQFRAKWQVVIDVWKNTCIVSSPGTRGNAESVI
jgi:hypothetical protein